MMRSWSLPESGKPLLGICLGMQLLFDGSTEGTAKGLGLVEGSLEKFHFEKQYFPIPHMGWNNVRFKGGRLGKENQRFYFVHSYYLPLANDHSTGLTTYGEQEFTSVIEKDNIFGTQFHPEKSHRYGMDVLRNFCRFGIMRKRLIPLLLLYRRRTY